MFYVNIMKNGYVFFFILVVNIGNDVFMFGGFVSIVFGMCIV